MNRILDSNDTICAISTPPGRGGIAVIRISGPNALQVADTIWKGKKISGMDSHTAHLGEILDGGELLDQAVATVFRAPNSFTGEDVVELSVHGSVYVQRRLLELLTQNENLCRLADPGEFSRRAYLSGRLDLAQTEAVADLISATSRGAQRLATSQMKGALSRRIKSLRDQLVELGSLLELELDFSEEDVEFASRTKLIELCEEVESTLSRLTASFSTGKAIVEGIPVVIVGAPNAGKSTLLNELLEDDKAIVSAIPGTTRDVIEDTFELNGTLFRLIDTAGIRNETEDLIERAGIERAYERLDKASIILFVYDPTNSAESVGILKTLLNRKYDSAKHLIPVLNKTDIAVSSANITSLKELIANFSIEKMDLLTLMPIVNHSSLNEESKEEIRKSLITVSESFVEENPSDIVLTNLRHYKSLQAALDSIGMTKRALELSLTPDLVAQHLRRTINELSTVTGDIATPELLNTIFSRFCIGK